MTELVGKYLGGYVLEEEIGRGSTGVVYRAKQVALGRDVAIKIFPRAFAPNSSFIARFVNEAQIIAKLSHPNIVHIHNAGQQDDILYFVMEWIAGPTIGSLLRLDGSLPQHLSVEYVAQAADALDAAYQECGVIHRDIKPEHLMLDRWGRLKVLDFGQARASDLPPITPATALADKLSYASPEQILGQELDHRSDIYGLGVVLYEMVTGHRPFSGSSLQEEAEAIIAGRILPPTELNADLSPALEQIILTAVSANRDARFTHAGQMANVLRALQLHPVSVAPPASPSPARSSQDLQPRRSYTPVVVGMLTLPMRPLAITSGTLARNDAH